MRCVSRGGRRARVVARRGPRVGRGARACRLKPSDGDLTRRPSGPKPRSTLIEWMPLIGRDDMVWGNCSQPEVHELGLAPGYRRCAGFPGVSGRATPRVQIFQVEGVQQCTAIDQGIAGGGRAAGRVANRRGRATPSGVSSTLQRASRGSPHVAGFNIGLCPSQATFVIQVRGPDRASSTPNFTPLALSSARAWRRISRPRDATIPVPGRFWRFGASAPAASSALDIASSARRLGDKRRRGLPRLQNLIVCGAAWAGRAGNKIQRCRGSPAAIAPSTLLSFETMLARTGKLKVPSHASVGLVREGTDLESLEPRYAMSLRNKNLHLTMLGLYRLPDHVFTLSHLLRLDVGHNELSELSPAIGQLAKLEELWLNDNPIAALPTEIQFCKKLKCIDLRNTDLATVPRELGRLRNLNEIDLTNTPYEASLAAQHLFTSPIDTDRLMSYLDVQDKRATLRLDMFERACAGVYREIADVPAQRDFISDLVAAVSDEFPDLPDMRNVVRNCDRLLPADPGLHPPELAARRIRAQFTGLRRENDKKRLSAELELKMRALYYDNIDPAAVEGYIRSIYVAEDDEKALELEDIQFLIKNAARLLPASPGEIDGRAVRSSVWDLRGPGPPAAAAIAPAPGRSSGAPPRRASRRWGRSRATASSRRARARGGRAGRARRSRRPRAGPAARPRPPTARPKIPGTDPRRRRRPAGAAPARPARARTGTKAP